MPLKEFNTLDDLERNYHDTYVEYQGELCYALVQADVTVKLFKIDNSGMIQQDNTVVINFDDKKFKDVKLDFPKLGWISYRGTRYYLYRSSKRQFRFGAGKNNTGSYLYEEGMENPVKNGSWNAFTKEVLYWLKKGDVKYDPRKDGYQRLTSEIAILGDSIYKGIYKIATKDDDKFKLLPYWDDSITYLDLQTLGVPVVG